MTFDPALLLGPMGLAIAALAAVVALWRDHVRDDDLKDEALRSLTQTVATFPGTIGTLTAAVLDASKRRSE